MLNTEAAVKKLVYNSVNISPQFGVQNSRNKFIVVLHGQDTNMCPYTEIMTCLAHFVKFLN